MISYSFNTYAHPNITALHRATLEITKENFLTKNGDCIIGIKADFDLAELKRFIKKIKKESIKIQLMVDATSETIIGKLNRDFNDAVSIVIRKSDFISNRTLVYSADKSASDIRRDLIKEVIENKNKIKVCMSQL